MESSVLNCKSTCEIEIIQSVLDLERMPIYKEKEGRRRTEKERKVV